MTSLIKPVPQREIEGKKQGSGERTAQILKKKEKQRCTRGTNKIKKKR